MSAVSGISHVYPFWSLAEGGDGLLDPREDLRGKKENRTNTQNSQNGEVLRFGVYK